MIFCVWLCRSVYRLRRTLEILHDRRYLVLKQDRISRTLFLPPTLPRDVRIMLPVAYIRVAYSYPYADKCAPPCPVSICMYFLILPFLLLTRCVCLAPCLLPRVAPCLLLERYIMSSRARFVREIQARRDPTDRNTGHREMTTQ